MSSNFAVEEQPCDCYATEGRFEDDGTRARPGAHDRDCISKAASTRAPSASGEYRYCGADLGREHPPYTCNRRVAHKGRCSHAHDRGSEEFSSAWAEYFAAHPEVLASFNHQRGYWPPGYNEFGDD